MDSNRYHLFLFHQQRLPSDNNDAFTTPPRLGKLKSSTHKDGVSLNKDQNGMDLDDDDIDNNDEEEYVDDEENIG